MVLHEEVLCYQGNSRLFTRCSTCSVVASTTRRWHRAQRKVDCTCYIQVRSAKLGSLPLTSLALLHQPGQASEGHPTVLAGSYDNQVWLQNWLVLNPSVTYGIMFSVCNLTCTIVV